MLRRASILAGVFAIMARGAALAQAVSGTAAAVTGSAAVITGSSPATLYFNPLSSPAPAAYAQGSGGMAELMIYLFIIVAMLGGGLYFMRSGFRMMPKLGKGERKLQVTEMRSLGNRQFLIVAEYENRKMLLGVCPGRIDYLSTLSGPESNDDFSAELRKKME